MVKMFPSRQIVSFLILFTLLISTLSVDVIKFLYQAFVKFSEIPAWFDTALFIFPVFGSIFRYGSFGLVALFMVVNRHEMQRMNINWSFLPFFFFSGLVLFLTHLRGLGWITGAALILFVIYILINRDVWFFTLDKIDQKEERINVLVICVAAACFIGVWSFLDLPKRAFLKVNL
jgi:hypothetical protein